MTSCDELLTEKFVVDNDYYNSVSISYKNANGYIFDTIIPPKTFEFELFINTGYGQSVYEFELDRLFEYFIVESDTITSNMDYRDNLLWDYYEFSETTSEYRLRIDSTHFEVN